MTETPHEEPPATPEPPAPAPAPAPVRRYEFVRARPFQVALAALLGLVIGGIGGLAIGFFAGNHFGGGTRHRDHGYYQQVPRRDRMPMQPPRKVVPQKPFPAQPSPTGSPSA